MVQLRFLRLHSSTATQSMTYSCHPGHRLGLADTEVKFLTDTKKQSYLGNIKDCVVCFFSLLLYFSVKFVDCTSALDEVCNAMDIQTRIFYVFVQQPGEENISGARQSVFEFEDLHLLPLRDVAVQRGVNFTHQFGFSVGPVCFS